MMGLWYTLWNTLGDSLTRTFRTLNVWQWLVLLAVPPLIVLLYFLKLRRQPLEVPSTYLWRRTIEDLHVNSLWQKLRQNLLLFLQLLLILLAILACLRPSWQGSQLTEERYVFLVDTSASMSATDVAPTRLEAAKSQLIDLVDQRLKPGSVAMVISFSDQPKIEQPFTDNRNLLKRRIRAIQATQRSSELDGAIRVASALANPGRSATEEQDVAAAEALPASLIIFSDGRFRGQPQVAMGNLKPVYVPLGTEKASNVGIVAFSASVPPDRPENLRLFGRLHNFSDDTKSVVVQLAIHQPNRQLLDASRLELPAGESRGVEFSIDAVNDGRLTLEIEQADDFALDNVAHVALNKPRLAQVLLMTPRNDALQTVLNIATTRKTADIRVESPSFLEQGEYHQLAASGAFDLIIFDQCRPKSMPLANTFFIGQFPPDERWSAGETIEVPQIIDADRSHPLMRYVEPGDIKWIVQARPLTLPPGGTVLIESHLGVLLGIAPRDGFEDVVQGFDIVSQNEKGERLANTDWPIRVSFPVFIGNLLTYLGGQVAQTDQVTTQPGQPVSLHAAATAETLRITTPDGVSAQVQRGARNAFLFGGTESIGVYDVRESNKNDITQRFAVNLFDEIESNVRPLASVNTQYEEIAGQAVWETKRHEGWKYLLLGALAVLLVEWYIYNRRVYI